ncbi:DNA repair protein RecN [Chitiniphilus shinanonensis]|uniref:DNA repair protein RecN n=2 Tax=Chitiniphilus shinanonensis TaxID=553088 RepID=F8WSX4_9NEIS|nr:DNA repair protein RecN [Chitiniphilus shinanonensis]BAK53956.1 DNA repair protein RecN [Chitiniphilus shinanonensis]
MLSTLSLKNFVIVDDLTLEFGAGLSVLTGETGAGKSIILDALGLLLGDRADPAMLRHGTERAELAAEFDLTAVPAARAWLADHELAGDEADSVLLRRTLDAAGKSKAFINGAPATLAQLKALGETLVDIHGQHAHQQLLRPEVQRALLDDYAGAAELAGQVALAWRGWRAAAAELDDAERNAAAYAAETERLQWQVDEVAALSFAAEEWPTLSAEHARLHHAAGLIDGVQSALLALSEGDDNLQGWLSGVTGRVGELIDYDPALGEVGELLGAAEASLSEAVHALQRYADRLELDPARLAEVEARMDAIWRTARKYRVEPERLPQLLGDWQARLEVIGGSGGLAALRQRVATAEGLYRTAAEALSARRAAHAATLAEAVTREMRPLALADSRFEIALVAGEAGAHGLEGVEFRVAHGATPARDMAKIVSGGELSRISLALQVIVSNLSGVPTLVFDEVDVGIGGRVAEIVGRLLAGLGQARQVLCITHLPQVAACGSHHFVVSKRSDADGIVSAVTALTPAQRVEEIARMLGGLEITETTRRHAAELLGHD